MDDQLEMFPSGLSQSQLERLSAFSPDTAHTSVANLGDEVDKHLERARAAYGRNRIVNIRLATAIAETIRLVLGKWDTLETNHRHWLACAIFYFARCNDDEPDFDSPIGFEDDSEVLNACLRFAGLSDICLNVEDFDDV